MSKLTISVLLINEPSGAWVGTSLHIIMYEDYSTTVPAPRKYIPLSTWLLRVKVMIFLLGAFHYLKKLKISSRPKKMKAAEPKANPKLVHRHWSRKSNRETRESCRIFGRYLHRTIPPASRVQGLHQRRSLVSLSK